MTKQLLSKEGFKWAKLTHEILQLRRQIEWEREAEMVRDLCPYACVRCEKIEQKREVKASERLHILLKKLEKAEGKRDKLGTKI